MDPSRIELGIGTVPDQPAGGARSAMKVMLPGRWFYGALIVALSVWVLHSFLHALLVACVTAIASWPLYRQFAARLPRMPRSATSLIFTCVMTIFVLAPLTFGLGALLTEAHALLLEIAAADKKGIAVPHGVDNLPLVGPWVAARWQSELAHPGALFEWAQRMDATALLAWAQPLGQFMIRHLFIVTFTILVLFFLYQEGESLAQGFRRLLRGRVGERAEGYVDLAVRALRASVNSMLLVGLFVGFASWAAFAVAGVPHAALWAVITGSLALVPFLGYVAVAALALKLTMAGAATPALLSLGLGCAVLFCGDKIVRPMIARGATRLRFVWMLMGCLGGFEVLGLVGLVVGPVLLTITRELWEQRVREPAPSAVTNPTSPVDKSA
jgi:predicted PurR-regulated permease PerM